MKLMLKKYCAPVWLSLTGKKSSSLDCQDGVTILEVMISMLILSIALLGLLGMGMTAMEGNQWSNYSTKSTQLLQQKIEQLRNTDSPQSGSEQIDDITLNWTVGNAGSHLRSVDITANWVNQRQQSVSNSLSTLIKTDSI